MTNTSLIPVDFDPFAEEKEIEKIIFTNGPQREIWLSCILGGEDANLAYNESISLELDGPFYFEPFKRAISDLILRHEALRSTVSANGETLIIYRDFPVELSLLDISNLDIPAQKENLNIFLRKELGTPLDLLEGPLFRVFLHKLSENKHYFTLIKHHVIGDGWSTGIMLEDLSKMYNAYSKGAQILLDRSSQISDYVAAEDRFKLTEEYKQTENYWLNLYKDSVPVLDLPTDRQRTSPRSYKGNRIDYPLSKDLVNQLKTIGAKAGCSLVTTLLSAFEILLYQQTNQKDIVVGLPSSGQSASGLHDVVGNCVNLLPLKSTIDPAQSFIEYLKKRKGEVLDAYDHQRLTFGELIKKLYIQRDDSRITLVPVIFNIDMGMDQAVSFDGLKHKLVSNPRAYENFEIYLNATGSKEGLVLEWSYNTDLFNPETIKRFHKDYQSMLEKIVINPAVSLLELKEGNERQIDLNPIEKVRISNEQTLNDLISEAVNDYPNNIAISFNGSSLTYQELNERANQLASFLTEKGLQIGDIIGLSIERSLEMIISLLAILKTGAIYVPLDPEYPRERIEFMLEDSSAKILLISKRYKNRYQTKSLEMVIEDILPQLASYPKQNPEKRTNGNDLAYILYTSGSTGKPKGVKITHRNLVNFLVSMKAKPGITPDDRLLAITTISFDIAGLELYLPLISGAEVIIADAEATKDGRLLLSIIEEKNVTIMQATPSTWQMMIDSDWKEGYSLKILSGGEALPKELAEKLLVHSAELWNMYGPTETTIWSAIKQILPGDRLITIGLPINNTQIYIMNEHGKELAAGMPGELYIGGEGVTEGYLNRSELTAEKFVTDQYSKAPNAKLYKTGDLGKMLENGEFLCLGRIDQQVKIRGHRIELGEIESIISEQTEIKQSVVVAREDTPSDKRLIAYVILKEDLNTSTELSWKDRWDTLYDIGAKTQQTLSLSEQHLDGTLLEHLENSEDLARQSAEWLHVSIERIKSIGSKSIFEIGSGAGQLLFALAPDIDRYIATDYAQTAIDKLNEQLHADPVKWSHTKACVATADNFTAVADTSIDLVLIHSVAQYFPNADYLIKVIKESIKSIKANGCIFIGDMQGKNSLEMFHAMDQLPHSSDSNSVATFKKVVSNRVRIEEEFVADPDFFYGLLKLFPEITGVDVQLRKGQSLNETTKYHYDIWLYVNIPTKTAIPDISINWENNTTISEIEKLLADNLSSVVEVKNILNVRTAKDHRLYQLLKTANPDTPLIEIKNEIESVNNGIHPDLFWEMGERLNYNAHIRWSTDGTDGLFDVVFIPFTEGISLLPESPSNATLSGDIYDFARAPFSKNEISVPKEMISKWKKNLSEVLPPYMIPEDFIALKSFPLTPNAKINRDALPKPGPKEVSQNNIEEREILTENEQLISDIWTTALRLDNLKITDDFFELGGHSLLAVKIMVAIEKKTGKRLPLASLFNNSTIEKLAKLIELSEEDKIKWDSLVPIKASGNNPPLYIVHGWGLNVMGFRNLANVLDPNQPVYGLQAKGLHGKDMPVHSAEETAANYLAEIIRHNPKGPYFLSGYSTGGIIAFEMAKQFKKIGREVSFLALFDTFTEINDYRAFINKGEILALINYIFVQIKYAFISFFSHPTIYLRNRFNYIFGTLYNVYAKFKPEKEFNPEDPEHVINNLQLSNDKAIKNYNFEPYDGNAYLFKANDIRTNYFLYFDTNGWKPYFSKKLTIIDVPIGHLEFFEPEHVSVLADKLQKELNKAKNYSNE